MIVLINYLENQPDANTDEKEKTTHTKVHTISNWLLIYVNKNTKNKNNEFNIHPIIYSVFLPSKSDNPKNIIVPSSPIIPISTVVILAIIG